MIRGRQLLPLCICASLAAHLAVILYFPDLPPPRAQRPGDAGLRVTLTRASAGTLSQATAAIAERPVAGSLPARRDTTPAAVEPAHHRRKTAAATVHAASTAHTAIQLEPATTPETRNTAGSPLLAHLHDAMQSCFHYPLLARRRGWEGTVRVGLRISATGQISQLRIIESSHHAVLDQAAIDCLSRVRQMPGAMAWLGGHDSDIVLPVEYRLTDS